MTRARTMSINCRNSTNVELFPSRRWSRRLPVMIKFLKDNGPPSVIGVQECNAKMATQITDGLGARYNFWGTGTSKIIWDSNKWKVLDQFQTTLTGSTRPLTMLKLKSINTGEFAWFASTHFTVDSLGRDLSAVREEQMRLVIKHVEARPDHERVVIFGDFNSWPENTSVRKIASDAGYVHLQKKAGLDVVTGESWNSFNGFKITKRDGRWIDDILTSPAVTPYAASLKRTDPGVYTIAASDHNGIRASVEF